jgi:hypothetical protein
VFQEVAPKVFPELEVYQRALTACTDAGFILTGAGPALYSIPTNKTGRTNKTEYERVAAALRPLGAQVYLVNTVTKAPQVTPAADAGGAGVG